MKRKAVTTLTALVLATLLSACSSTYKPAPIGDELVWRSDSSRPGWTVDAPAVDRGEFYAFMGQSLYHSTERAARTNAEVDAAAQAASFLSRDLQRNYEQLSTGGTVESGVQDVAVTTTDSVKMSSDMVLTKLSHEGIYLEQWRKGNVMLWKAYVKMHLPKSRI